MGRTWQKIKAWTTGIVAVLVVLYLAFFVYNNSYDVPFWYWFGHYPHVSAFFLALVAFIAGAVATILLQTMFRALRQVRDVRDNRRLDRVEREQADVRAKAAMLHPTAAAEGTTIRVENLGGH